MTHSKLTQHLVFLYAPRFLLEPNQSLEENSLRVLTVGVDWGGQLLRLQSYLPPKPPHLSIQTDLCWVQVLATRKAWEPVGFSRQS